MMLVFIGDITALHDQFTTDGTVESPRICEPGPGALTIQSGAWAISNGRLTCSSNADGDTLLSGSAAADAEYVVTVLVRNQPALIWRAADNSNYWLLQPRNDQGRWEFYRKQSGSFTLMQSVTAPCVFGSTYTLMVRTLSDRMSLYVDGIELISIRWPFNATADKAGVRLGKFGVNASPTWDDLIVRSRTGALNEPGYVRHMGNPIVAKGSAGTWEATDVANPDVFWDTPNSRWVMSYSGYSATDNKWRLGLAYSTDLLNWTKEAANPVFSPNVSEGYLACNGSVVYKSGTYYHFYNNGVFDGVYLATSTDLLNWTRQNGGSAVIAQGAGGAIDAVKVADPMVRVMGDGSFKCWYAAENGVRVYATATSSDGVTWTKQGQLFGRATFSDAYAGEPSAYGFSGSNYAVTCDAGISGQVRFINEAFTLDGGSTWRWRGRILEGSGSGWDSVNCFDSCVVESGGVKYLFYAGAPTSGLTENMGAQIGAATATA